MKRLMVGIVAVLMMACVAPQVAQPQILSAVNGQSVEPNAYQIRLNFVVFEDEIAQSPNITKAFQAALNEWVEHLPLECLIFVEKSSPFLFVPFGPDITSEQPGIVRVHMVDIHIAPYSMPVGILGYWNWKENALVLDKGMLENDPDKAYMVCLHELGHVLGLPHFVNQHDLGALSGWIVIPDEFDAKQTVMCPVSSDSNKHAKLSQLEISLAQKNLLGLQQLSHNDCFHWTSR